MTKNCKNWNWSTSEELTICTCIYSLNIDIVALLNFHVSSLKALLRYVLFHLRFRCFTYVFDVS